MRKYLITWIQVLYAAIGGLLFAAAAGGLLALTPRVGGWLIGVLTLLIPFSDKIEKILGVGIAEALAAPIIAFVVGVWLLWKARGLIRWAADRLFPPFDSKLLRPIRRGRRG
jgi:hypothetical protein